ncbi:hypothetical protein [Candidatus Thiodictyon syntrophicum]|uniref:hypothetical protein n=1 Tax=Candidatus Thiodictyon syntrophicum TaxID=1166950 RepID=UPI0012FD0142|nr:hypothetical protein [Candidatus Thiodictyon syntrophicum]
MLALEVALAGAGGRFLLVLQVRVGALGRTGVGRVAVIAVVRLPGVRAVRVIV